MSITVRQDDVRSPDVLALLAQHQAQTSFDLPPESIHSLNADELRAPNVTFWVVFDDDVLSGCAAPKELSPGHGEVKSMHTIASARGKGIGRALLAHIVAEGRNRSYTRLSLETGSSDDFGPAQRLYARHGFAACQPFATYGDDPNSLYMTLELGSSP